MFVYPEKAPFNKLLPKIKIYANAKPSKKVKAMFVSQVKEIVWKYKLAQDTVNLPPRDGFREIQIFEIALKGPELGSEVLRVIDKAIPYPIFYQLRYKDRVKRVAAYKRPAADSSDKWVTADYFETDWQENSGQAKPLPITLDLKGLYEQMLLHYIEQPIRPVETLGSLVERVGSIRKIRRELKTLEARMKREKQFNRRVDLNVQLRALQEQLKKLQ